MSEQIDFTVNANMHAAFQREIARLRAAIAAADLSAPLTVGGIQRRYRFFSDTLHTHHEAEDRYLWPPALQQATPAEKVVLTAMESEHESLQQALESLDGAMTVLGPDTDVAGVQAAFDRLRGVLDGHCAHEERDAIPVLQKYVSREDLKEFMTYTRAQADSSLLLPWICDGASSAQVASTWGMLPGFVRVFVKPMTTRKYDKFTAECGV